MSQVNPNELNEQLLSALRNDFEPTPDEARRRIFEQLSVAALVAVSAGAVAESATRSFGRAWLHSRAFAVAVALPAGAALGAAGHAWLSPASAGDSAVAPAALGTKLVVQSAAASPDPAPVSPEQLLPEPAPRPAAPAAASAGGAPSASPRELPSLERELALLEQARTRLSEGDAAQALALLRAHEASYPKSSLAQEREALAIKVLVAAGRREEARRRAQAFSASYPGSPLRGSVERAVGAIP